MGDTPFGGPMAAVVQIKLPGQFWDDFSGRVTQEEAELFIARAKPQSFNFPAGTEFRVRESA